MLIVSLTTPPNKENTLNNRGVMIDDVKWDSDDDLCFRFSETSSSSLSLILLLLLLLIVLL